MEAYLDNSATTRCTEAVAAAVTDAMLCRFGNPSSAHGRGLEAEHMIRDSAKIIADTLKCDPQEIVFTSGGTESNNWAVFGSARANRRKGMHIITSSVEHASVLMPMKALEKEGFRVTYLGVDHDGQISLEELKNALDEETILVSLMFVNNEVGTVFPIEQACALVHSFDPSIVFHTDAVQAYGKYELRPKRWGVDLLSVSGHKLHGPKGSGFLYVRKGTKLNPLILGGGQQRGMRSGTDNVPGAVGLATAAKEGYAALDENTAHMAAMKQRMTEGLKTLDQVVIHSPQGEEGAPHIVNASFVGIRSEVLLHALEERGICVSAGSACSTNKKLPVSGVLKEMNLSREEMESALRFSFSDLTTPEEIDYALDTLRQLLPVLRRYTRR